MSRITVRCRITNYGVPCWVCGSAGNPVETGPTLPLNREDIRDSGKFGYLPFVPIRHDKTHGLVIDAYISQRGIVVESSGISLLKVFGDYRPV